MLHKIVTYIAARNDYNAVDLPGLFFKNGFTTADWADLDPGPLLQAGNVFTGFRVLPDSFVRCEQFGVSHKIFMFRDPRDALVSQYYSDAFSHDIPRDNPDTRGRELFLQKRMEAQSADIDDWVLSKAGAFRRTMLACKPLLEDPNCLRLRYESYVFQKRRLVSKINRHFNWSLKPVHVEKLMTSIDIVPSVEDKMKFVRKAVPGDHRVKLKPETIRRLNNRLRDVMELYDYAP